MTRTTSVDKPTSSEKKPTRHASRTARALSPDTTLESFLDFPIENQRALTNVLIQQRKALGKTQYQIADEIQVNQTTISSVERRISPHMGWLTFAKIMHAYGLDLDYVMELLGVLPPKPERVNPRISSIMHTLEDIEDPEWLDFALTTIEVWLKGVQQQRRLAEK